MLLYSCGKNADVQKEAEVVTYAGGSNGYKDGESKIAQFDFPTGLTMDNSGNLIVADAGWNNSRIRRVDKNGYVSTLAGTGQNGFQDGPSVQAKFFSPYCLAADAMGNIYIADQNNCRIRKIDKNGNVSTLAGMGEKGYFDGPGNQAKFYWPKGIAVDLNGNVYVADSENNRIRKIDKNGNVTTLAGTGEAGFKDGTGNQAKFDQPSGIAVDKYGIVYVADTDNNRIRGIDKNGNVSTIAGNGGHGSLDGWGTQAAFSWPTQIVVDNLGNLYIADDINNLIRKIDVHSNVSTVAGTGVIGLKNGPVAQARFHRPMGITVDGEGSIYVADTYNNCIRKILK